MDNVRVSKRKQTPPGPSPVASPPEAAEEDAKVGRRTKKQKAFDETMAVFIAGADAKSGKAESEDSDAEKAKAADGQKPTSPTLKPTSPTSGPTISPTAKAAVPPTAASSGVIPQKVMPINLVASQTGTERKNKKGQSDADSPQLGAVSASASQQQMLMSVASPQFLAAAQGAAPQLFQMGAGGVGPGVLLTLGMAPQAEDPEKKKKEINPRELFQTSFAAFSAAMLVVGSHLPSSVTNPQYINEISKAYDQLINTLQIQRSRFSVKSLSKPTKLEEKIPEEDDSRGHRWTDADTIRMMELKSQGEPNRAIAATLGRSTAAVSQRYKLVKAGKVHCPGYSPPMPKSKGTGLIMSGGGVVQSYVTAPVLRTGAGGPVDSGHGVGDEEDETDDEAPPNPHNPMLRQIIQTKLGQVGAAAAGAVHEEDDDDEDD